MTVHREKAFEDAIEAHLLSEGGYRKGVPAQFDAALALDQATLIEWLKSSQPKAWEKLAGAYGDQAEAKVTQWIAKQCDQNGMLHCLRHGVVDRGVKLSLCQFLPASRANPETMALYGQNILTVTRQVHHDPKRPADSVDLLLSVNGLPVATAELKTQTTGQTVAHARRQYQERDPNAPLLAFKKRALVHFAVDADLVFMATRLAGEKTFFLPFNRGDRGGAGNPLNPNGYKTAYLWEEVWARDSWLDILARFVHLQVEERTDARGKKQKRETLIFPRFHQLDAVRKVIDAARVEGPGHTYLIQHSAGSGKSNSIAWLAHRLATLHDDKDDLVFSTVIVVTDRRVLDSQLQDTIYQFEHKQGLIARIDHKKGSKSGQLVEALDGGKRIVIVTLQTFPNVMGQVGELGNRNFAVIADEAHSSQTGDSAAKLKSVLSAKSLDDAEAEDAEPDPETTEDRIEAAMRARGRQRNLSFFAFTATPKKKTLELFGRPGADGEPEAFHLYSMRQAIEEGFILDVLRNYTNYSTFYRLDKAVEDDPDVNKRQARSAIARFVSLHPHNLAQKTEVMVEHFRRFTRHKIGGRAKAMVVTRSRLHAVRYRQEFDRYIKAKGYGDIRALVAFSGKVQDPDVDDVEYTETGMNGFPDTELPDRFATDDFQVLLVAEKYQTGFDQPLLHTMYVDKTLKGLAAVQTLARLNRTTAGKEDTFVLDFVNDAADIQEAFKPYFETTAIDAPTDPNQLYTLLNRLKAFQYFYAAEVDEFAEVFFRSASLQDAKTQGLLNRAVDPAAQRFREEPDDDQREDFRASVSSYVRLYAFVSQMIDFADADLEKHHVYMRWLSKKLDRREAEDRFQLDDEVALAFYRLQKQAETNASLTPGDAAPVTGPSEVGTGAPPEDDKAPLSQIINVLNDRFGTDFTEEDRLLLDQLAGDMMNDDVLTEQARNNPIDAFRLAFEPKAMNAIINRQGRNNDIVSKLYADEDFRAMIVDALMKEVFARSNSQQP